MKLETAKKTEVVEEKETSKNQVRKKNGNLWGRREVSRVLK